MQPVYYSEVLEVLPHVSAARTFACAGSRCYVFYTHAQWMWRGKLSVIRDVSSDSVGRTVFKMLAHPKRANCCVIATDDKKDNI